MNTRLFLALTIIVVTVCGNAFAQNNAILSIQGFVGDNSVGLGQSLFHTDDGGFILTLRTTSTTTNFDLSCEATTSVIGECLFQKYDATGLIKQWEKCYNDSGDYLQFLIPLSDGSFIVAGIGASSTVPMGYMIRHEDASGNVLWRKVYGGSNGGLLLRDIKQTPNGGYVLVGLNNSFGAGIEPHYGNYMDGDIWVIQLDSAGNKKWSKNIGGTGDEEPYKVVLGPNGSTYVIGYTSSNDYDCTGLHGAPGLNGDSYVAMLDSTGNIMWHKCLGGKGHEVATSGADDGHGGLYICSVTDSMDGDVQNFKGGYQDFWVVHLDTAGTIKWSNCYGGPNQETPHDICRTTDNSIWVTGYASAQGGQVDTSFGGGNAWVVRLDSTGTFKSSRVMSCPAGAIAYQIAPLKNNGVAVAGSYDGPGIVNGTMPTIFYTGVGSVTQTFLNILAPWTLGIDDPLIALEVGVLVGPNPSTGDFKITIRDKPNSKGVIKISDMMGRTVMQRNIIDSQSETFTNTGLSKGTYMISYLPNAGLPVTKRILIF